MTRFFSGPWLWLAVFALLALLLMPFGSRLGKHPEALNVEPQNADNIVALSRIDSIAGLPAPKGKRSAPPPATRAVNGAPSEARRLQGSARKMARKASLNLIVGDVGRAIASLESLVRSLNGDVTKLDDQRPATQNERHEANLTLVIPANRFDVALSRFAGVGAMRSQTVSAEDVGDQIVDQEAHLRNLRRTENDLLRIMDRSGKVGEVLEVENQLSDIRGQIETLDAQTQALKARVSTSTIDVHLEEEIRTIGAEPNAASQLGDAWAAAWHASREAAFGAAARIFFLIAFAPYWLTLLALGALVLAYARRRRLRGEDV